MDQAHVPATATAANPARAFGNMSKLVDAEPQKRQSQLAPPSSRTRVLRRLPDVSC